MRKTFVRTLYSGPTESKEARKEGAHNQSCKKIIDLDLKDQDHLIDLDLLGNLDHCW